MLSAGAMLLPNAAGYSPSASPSQLVILGMHHSGTSLLANLTMMMGAHGDPTFELRPFLTREAVDAARVTAIANA